MVVLSVAYMASSLITLLLLSTLHFSYSEPLSPEDYATQAMACALLVSQAMQDDPAISTVLTASVHDPDITITKLTAEICLNCITHISLELANHIVEEGLEPESDQEIRGLLAYNQTKYLARGADLSLTAEEETLMDLLLALLAEDDQDGDGYYEDYEDYEEYEDDWEL